MKRTNKLLKRAIGFIFPTLTLIGLSTGLCIGIEQNNNIVSKTSTDNKVATLSTNNIVDEPNSINSFRPTIGETKMINAINSFEKNSSMYNANDAYKFEAQSALNYDNGEASLINLIRNYIKFYRLDTNDRIMYTLPSSAISIYYNNQSIFNVQINLESVNGYVAYYNNANGFANTNEQESITTKNNILSFNAIKINNNAGTKDANKNSTINIIFIISMSVAGLAILLFLILFIKNRITK